MKPNNPHDGKYDNLNSTGFAHSVEKLKRGEKIWNEMYNKLISYKEQYGDCLVSQRYEEDDNVKLGRWVDTQRLRYKYNKLSNHQINQLKQIGFVFVAKQITPWNDMDNEIRWDDMFNRLELYKEKYGNCFVPQKYKDNDDKRLGSWVMRQRRNYRSKILSKYRIDKLNSIGFVFNPREEGKMEDNETRWDDMYNRLVLYKEIHGDCLVPNRYKDNDDKQLGIWCKAQRYNYKNNQLSMGHINRLNSIGFVFSQQQERCDNQKICCKEDKLSIQHVEKLNSIGFVFSKQRQWDNAWNEMYKRLVSYKEKYGNCLVPYLYEEDRKLGRWVRKQRHKNSNNKLSIKCIDKLKSIGFVFNVRQTMSTSIELEKNWNHMYYQLVLYKQKYGNCLVPGSYIDSDDTQLGIWVKNQRQNYKNNILTNDQFKKLQSIGFVFSIYEHDDDVKEGEEERRTSKKCFCEELRCTLPNFRVLTHGSTANIDDSNSSIFADAEEEKEDFVLSTTSSFLTSDVRSNWNLSAAGNTKNATCDDNDSVFADAEEDTDGSWGYF